MCVDDQDESHSTRSSHQAAQHKRSQHARLVNGWYPYPPDQYWWKTQDNNIEHDSRGGLADKDMYGVEALRCWYGLLVPSRVHRLALKEEDEFDADEPGGYQDGESNDKRPEPSLGENADV